jgi:hypothetical protein
LGLTDLLRASAYRRRLLEAIEADDAAAIKRMVAREDDLGFGLMATTDEIVSELVTTPFSIACMALLVTPQCRPPCQPSGTHLSHERLLSEGHLQGCSFVWYCCCTWTC